MNDPIKNMVMFEGCGSGAGREFSLETLLALLGRDLLKLGRRLEAKLDGDACLLTALRGLDAVLGWASVMSTNFDIKARTLNESYDIYRDLLDRVERGPGLKVPGSHASLAKTGAKVELGAGLPVPAYRNASAQTETAISVCALDGGSPPGHCGCWHPSLPRARGPPR